MSAVIEIDTLELEGFTAEEGRRAAQAFEDELNALLNRYGLPEGKTANDVANINLGDLPRTTNTPEGIGREMAKALFGELWL